MLGVHFPVVKLLEESFIPMESDVRCYHSHQSLFNCNLAQARNKLLSNRIGPSWYQCYNNLCALLVQYIYTGLFFADTTTVVWPGDAEMHQTIRKVKTFAN